MDSASTVCSSRELMVLLSNTPKDASFQITPEKKHGQKSCTVRILTPEEAGSLSPGDETFFKDFEAVFMMSKTLFPDDYLPLAAGEYPPSDER